MIEQRKKLERVALIYGQQWREPIYDFCITRQEPNLLDRSSHHVNFIPTFEITHQITHY